MSAVPKLRFPEFEGEWSLQSLGAVSEKPFYGMNSEATSYDGYNKYIRITDIDETTRKFGASAITSPAGGADKRYKLGEGDIVFARTGASVGKSYLYNKDDGDLFFAGFLIKFHIQKAYPKFVFFYTLTSQYGRWVIVNSARSGQPGINAEEYKSLEIPSPTLPEQQKIASFLSAVDKKIDLLRQKKDTLELYKKGLMQKIFSQEIRFKQDDGSDFPDWEEVALGDVLHEHKEKSAGQEPVFSVSVSKGLVDQIEHLGRSFSAADTGHYNKAKPHDVIYTKSPTGNFPLGIIKQSTVGFDVIVSPLYGVFTPETPALGFILNAYFESEINVGNYLSPLVQKGAKNTIACTNKRFLEGRLRLPRSHDEQRKIAGFLAVIQKKIAVTSSQIEQMETFKKGLLQQMFV